HLGRAVSKQRRRQMAQGKAALNGAGVSPAAEDVHVDGAGSGREQARARRAEASRSGSAGISRPQRKGRVTHPPKVIVSPTHRDQRVTGLRIGPGVRVTGDEPGAALAVSGTQYVAADGPPPAPAAGTKVGMVRTPQGLVVSGTTVRSRVPITGDEPGEHLRITGEADQKLYDDLTPRSDGTYRSAQFPRRADPHGASAVGTRLEPQPGRAASSGDGPWHPLETTDDGLPVTGTAVGRSGRVTGNEAGACRPITGDQYQDLSSNSSECAGTGGGTAPAAHLNRARLDPVTAGKVTVAQTWGGQRVTGPSVEHRPNVTGDEPGACRPLTGTPYQGPSTTFAWCEPDDVESAAQRAEPRPEGVAVTGDLPTTSEKVTGTERGQRKDITGSSYYRDMRPAEPAADDWDGTQAFPVALARRMAVVESDEAATQEARKAAPPASSCITGSFAVGDGMVTGNNEFLFRPRQNREDKQQAITGEGRTEGRTITGSPSAWTDHDLVTGTEGYISAGRNPTEGGGRPHGWAGATRFKDLATPGTPRLEQNVTGLSGWNSQAAARVTLS
ncbi:MAG TPA: CsoS2 family carboxysome shell protein, partial [Cryptosporangiaceae bacterium]|nr:CsoS2 family carboxysome shell protein [Cryptosporangiaceae bacterium]